MSREYCGRFFVEEAEYSLFVDLGNIMEMARLKDGDWQILYHGGGKWSALHSPWGERVFAALLAYRREHQ